MNKEQIIKLTVEAVRNYDAKQKKSRYDKRLRNTKLLLKNYNLLKEHCKNAIYNKQQAISAEIALDVLDVFENYDHDNYIRAIKNSVARTQVILAHIEQMIKLYKSYCETSTKSEDLRRYRILCSTYFDELKVNEICENEHIDRSTYFRDINETCEKLSALIFGVDGLYACDKGETDMRLSM